MRTYLRFIMILILVSVSACQPWDEHSFPVNLSSAGNIFTGSFSINRGDIYSFNIGYACDCSGDAPRIFSFYNLIRGDDAPEKRVKPVIVFKVTRNGRSYISDTFELQAPGSIMYIDADENPDKDVNVNFTPFAWADLPVGEYEFELEVVRGDLRLRDIRSFLVIFFSSPKV